MKMAMETMKRLKALNPLEVAFLILLAARSVSEAFPKLQMYIGSVRLSVSVGLGLSLIAVGVIYLGLLFLRKALVVDRLGWIFLGWVLSLAPWVYLAAFNFAVAGLVGVREWGRLLYLVLVYLVVFSMVRRTDYRRVINAILLALPIPLSWTYYQVIFSRGEATSSGMRAYGPMFHPNTLATFLVVMIALTIWKLGQGRGPKRFLWGGLLALELPALVAPVSSNGWLIFGVFLLAVALLAEDKRLKRALAFTAGFFGLIFLLMIFQVGIVRTEFTQAFQIRSYQEIAQSGTPQNTIEGRILMWGQLLSKWRAHPLSGYGLNTSDFINPVVGKAPHNDYLRSLVEGGIPGLLIFVLFQVAAGWELFRLRARVPVGERGLRNLLGISLGLYLGWVVGGFGDNVLSQTAFQIYLWALIATATASASAARIQKAT